jgi:methionine-gamma-lyase
VVGEEDRKGSGVSDGLLRLSVGLEDVEDLWADLDGALEPLQRSAGLCSYAAPPRGAISHGGPSEAN